jgi:5'(3')-deoxyribonucleotidase
MNIGPYIVESMNYKIYMDLDGVVADFNKMVVKLTGKSAQELDDAGELWDVLLDQHSKGFKIWGDLDLMPDAKKLWNYIKKYDVTVLTSTGSTLHKDGKKEKKDWVRKHFGLKDIIATTSGSKKAMYAEPNAILIDDMAKNIDKWKSAGGIGIIHTSATNTINRLKTLGL